MVLLIWYDSNSTILRLFGLCGNLIMANQVDARGLSCPQPVILTRKAIKANTFPIEVLVETVTSRENVRRMSEKAGCQVRVDEIGEEFKLTITK